MSGVWGDGLRPLPLVGSKTFDAIVRIDTPQEAQYYANGGILQFVLRQLLSTKPTAVHA